MRRRFNSKLAVILFAICGLTVGLAVALHRFQADRSADLFLDHARDLVAEQDTEEAIRAYQSFLRLRPEAGAVRAEFGRLLHEAGDYDAAVQELEYSLRLNPSDVASRRLAAHCWLSLSRFADCREHLNRLEPDESDAERLDWLGQCQRGMLEPGRAAASFQAAIDAAPDRIETYERLAELMSSELDVPSQAETLLATMVRRNPDQAQAWLVRGRWLYSRARRLEASGETNSADAKQLIAIESAREAVRLDPANSPALFLLAALEFDQAEFDLAREHATSALQATPGSSDIYLLLAAIEKQADRPQAVGRWLEQGVKQFVGQPDEQEKLLFALANDWFDAGRPDKAVETIGKMRVLARQPARLRFLEARLDISRQNWASARDQLESISGEFLGRPNIGKRLQWMLGRCYRQLGQPEPATTAFRNAIALDPAWSSPRLDLAEVLAEQNRSSSAAEELEELLRLPTPPVEGWLLMARLRIAEYRRQPASEQDWSDAIDLIDRAQNAAPSRVEIPLMRAEVLVAQDRPDDADRLLVESLNRFDDAASRLRLYLGRSAIAQSLSRWEQAATILDDAESELGEPIEIRLARLSLFTQRFGKESVSRLQTQLSSAKELQGEPKRRLLLAVGRAALRIKSPQLGREVFQQLSEQFADDHQTWQFGHELFVTTKEPDGCRRCLERMESIRGRDADWHFGMAQIASLESEDLRSDGALATAIAHLSRAAALRPGWADALELKTRLLLRQGDLDASIQTLENALDSAGPSPDLVKALIASLYRQDLLSDAIRLLPLLDRQYSGRVNLPSERSTNPPRRPAVEVTQFPNALRAARRSVDESGDEQTHWWLARLTHLLAESGGHVDQPPMDRETLVDESERSFRRAIELAPGEPQVWLEFARLMSRHDREEEALRAIDESPAKLAPTVIARCYEELNRIDRAADTYELAVKRSYPDTSVLRLAAEFDLRNNRLASADRRLRRMLKTPGQTKQDVIWCRRQLAQLMVATGDPQALDRARTLVEDNLKMESSSIPDLRTKATILAAYRDPAANSLAMDAWKRIFDIDNAALALDHYQAARLLQTNGDWLGAAEHLRIAITRAGDDRERSLFIAAYVAGLLANNEYSEAELWLKKLSEIEVAARVHMKYRAEWLARRGQHSKALQCIEDAIPTHETSPTSKTELAAKRDASDLASVATEIERLGHLVQSDAEDVYQQAAEKFYRLAAEADPRKRFLLVSFLIRQQRIDEALSILRSSSIDREDLIDALSLIDALARSPGLELSQLESIDVILTELSVEYGESISLNAARASLQKASGNDERAMRIYREILEQDENNLLALNNLALLLVRSKDRLSDARRLSLRAVELGGRTPELLDTLAVIAIVAGQHQRAVELLQEVTRRSETPLFQLHLAIAHLRSGDAIRANEQFERARSAGLERSALGERDRRWFDEVTR